jgi:hypothetical protein
MKFRALHAAEGAGRNHEHARANDVSAIHFCRPLDSLPTIAGKYFTGINTQRWSIV